ncbi:endoplasmic reticulum membrane sensor NFE2L1a isoform X2 [Cottoperca gobio]|uniref:Endoplasmic reticulum membrane sensor NFE2L1 n=1 Tax=Cottoperca gobio TaxID=56716 RepID=A0A6J2Q590_COTGO|nr:endoplasmic reticulum membrane sensor NFE2L1-like isoform X2 [Cottoperca gobio]
MLYLKKYFTEGLIQMAILLSLCGVRVDMGLEPYLPPSLHEMILGPTSVLTQTQFHNLRNRLEDGHTLDPKSVDLDGFFTARRLLGWVRSLDRLQVPHAEVETWLVQREPDPLAMACPDLSTLERASAGVERELTAPPVETRAVLGALQEEEEEDKEECLMLLEETFPLSEEQPSRDVGGRRGDLERQPPGREPLLSHTSPTSNPSLDLELHWQDLLAIMEPENTEVDMMTSFDHTQNSRASETLQNVGSEALHRNRNDHDNSVTEADHEVLLMDTPLQHGLLGPPRQSELEPALLPLTPSAELDDHSSALNTRDTLKNSIVNPSHSLPDHTHLLEKNLSRDFCMGIDAEENSSTFNMNLLSQGLLDTMEGSPCSQYAPFPESLPSSDVNFQSRDLTPSRLTPSPEGNGMTRDLVTSPSSVFLVNEEEGVDNEDGLPSPLSDLLEDAVILDEMRLLDLALVEGFSPEMKAKLEEEGFLDSRITQQDAVRNDEHSGSGTAVTEDQGQPIGHQQDGEDEADSDSGLSLDFSHSPASPSASEASSYSSSSTSSSSCVSSVGRPFSGDEDEEEEGLVGSHMEVEVTIKQEDLEEEEMGAVGGGYPEDVKEPFLSNYGDQKLYNGVPWLEHIGHNHTYNQPWASDSSPSLGKMTTKHTKSSSRHDNAKPYHRSSSRHISESKMWSRDERRAQARKIPFSNELIVNLPVEEFNDLMTNYQLSEEQLNLIRDIRRRGKNKIAAQNCRKRKLDVLLELKDNVSGLRRYRSRLLREKQEALRNLQEMKRRLGVLYQDVFSSLRDEEGMPLNAMEYLLNFESNGSVTVASRQQGAALTKTSKKQRDKKK